MKRLSDNLPVPKAIFFDLDDTLLSAYRNPRKTWSEIIAEHTDALGPHDSRWVTAEVLDRVIAFLADEEGRKLWRLEGDATRRMVVRSAFHRLNLERPAGTEPLHGVDADRIADRFESWIEQKIALKSGVHALLVGLKTAGLRLGLITNGSSLRQRAKIARFDLEGYFDSIRIEEEQGYGKPDPMVYHAALRDLGVDASEAWMVGDDPLWDVAAPAALGVTAVHYSEDPLSPTPPEAAARISQAADLAALVANAMRAD